MSTDRAHPTVDPRNPEAWGQCDRCMQVVPHKTLRKEMMTSGDALKWNGLLICSRRGCMDKPHPQDRARRLRPDPVPVKNQRPEQ